MNKDINNFYQRVFSDKKMLEKFSKINKIDVSNIKNKNELCKIIETEVIPIAKEEGFNITAAELTDFIIESNKVKELSLDEMSVINGGVSLKNLIIKGSLLAYLVTPLMSNLNFASAGFENNPTSTSSSSATPSTSTTQTRSPSAQTTNQVVRVRLSGEETVREIPFSELGAFVTNNPGCEILTSPREMEAMRQQLSTSQRSTAVQPQTRAQSQSGTPSTGEASELVTVRPSSGTTARTPVKLFERRVKTAENSSNDGPKAVTPSAGGTSEFVTVQDKQGDVTRVRVTPLERHLNANPGSKVIGQDAARSNVPSTASPTTDAVSVSTTSPSTATTQPGSGAAASTDAPITTVSQPASLAGAPDAARPLKERVGAQSGAALDGPDSPTEPAAVDQETEEELQYWLIGAAGRKPKLVDKSQVEAYLNSGKNLDAYEWFGRLARRPDATIAEGRYIGATVQLADGRKIFVDNSLLDSLMEKHPDCTVSNAAMKSPPQQPQFEGFGTRVRKFHFLKLKDGSKAFIREDEIESFMRANQGSQDLGAYELNVLLMPDVNITTGLPSIVRVTRGTESVWVDRDALAHYMSLFPGARVDAQYVQPPNAWKVEQPHDGAQPKNPPDWFKLQKSGSDKVADGSSCMYYKVSLKDGSTVVLGKLQVQAFLIANPGSKSLGPYRKLIVRQNADIAKDKPPYVPVYSPSGSIQWVDRNVLDDFMKLNTDTSLSPQNAQMTHVPSAPSPLANAPKAATPPSGATQQAPEVPPFAYVPQDAALASDYEPEVQYDESGQVVAAPSGYQAGVGRVKVGRVLTAPTRAEQQDTGFTHVTSAHKTVSTPSSYHPDVPANEQSCTFYTVSSPIYKSALVRQDKLQDFLRYNQESTTVRRFGELALRPHAPVTQGQPDNVRVYSADGRITWVERDALDDYLRLNPTSWLESWSKPISVRGTTPGEKTSVLCSVIMKEGHTCNVLAEKLHDFLDRNPGSTPSGDRKMVYIRPNSPLAAKLPEYVMVTQELTSRTPQFVDRDALDHFLQENPYERILTSVTQNYETRQYLQSKSKVTRGSITTDSSGVIRQFFGPDVKVIGTLGAGNFGQVFKIQYPSGEVSAVKIIKQKIGEYDLTDKEFAINDHLFRVQLDQTSRVISYKKAFTSRHDRRMPAILEMECCTGGHSDRFMRQVSCYPNWSQKLRTKAMKVYMFNLLFGIAQMHNASVMHDDLKPENVMFAEDPFEPNLPEDEILRRCANIRITDFGLSEAIVNRRGDSAELSTVGKGTPLYMSPEVLGRHAGSMNKSRDVFAAGAMMQNILTRANNPISGAGSIYTLSSRYMEAVRAGNASNLLNNHIVRNPLERDLLLKLLDPNPDRRITASDALEHTWFADIPLDCIPGKLFARPGLPCFSGRAAEVNQFIATHPAQAATAEDAAPRPSLAQSVADLRAVGRQPSSAPQLNPFQAGLMQGPTGPQPTNPGARR